MAFSIYSEAQPVRQAWAEVRQSRRDRYAGLARLVTRGAIALCVVAILDIIVWLVAMSLGLVAMDGAGIQNLVHSDKFWVVVGINLAIMVLAMAPAAPMGKWFPFGFYYLYGMVTTLPVTVIVGVVVGIVGLPIVLVVSLFFGGDPAFAAIYTWYARVWLAGWLISAALVAFTEMTPRMSK